MSDFNLPWYFIGFFTLPVIIMLIVITVNLVDAIKRKLSDRKIRPVIYVNCPECRYPAYGNTVRHAKLKLREHKVFCQGLSDEE